MHGETSLERRLPPCERVGMGGERREGSGREEPWGDDDHSQWSDVRGGER